MTSDDVLLTGATGLLGGAVALELLQSTSGRVHCTVRAGDQESATTRLRAALTAAATAYGHADLVPAIAERVDAVRLDLAEDGRTSATALPPVGTVVHCAASLRWADRDEAEIERTNVGGTAALLRAAAESGGPRFCHVSTAYVAGTRTGLIGEDDPLPDIDQLNNAYERSKVRAERLVRDSGLDVQVVRPSIVIGHSQTFAATSFSGVYGMLDEMRLFQRRTASRLGSLLQHRGIKVLADPATRLNLIPVDLAARAIARIAVEGPTGPTFHIANSSPPGVEDCLRVGFELVGLPAPSFAQRDSELNDIDRLLQTDFYDTYMRSPKTFSVEHSESVCGAGALAYDLSPEHFSPFLTWFLDSGFRRGARMDAV